MGLDGNGSLSRPKLTKSCGAEEEDFKSEGQKYCILICLIFYYIYRVMQKPPYIGYDICVRHWLDRQFPDHWIARRGPVEWPPRSPDLNPLDFYLWGHLKAVVYQVKIQNVDHLGERIKASSPSVGQRYPYVLSMLQCPYRTRFVNKETIFPCMETFESFCIYL